MRTFPAPPLGSLYNSCVFALDKKGSDFDSGGYFLCGPPPLSSSSTCASLLLSEEITP